MNDIMEGVSHCANSNMACSECGQNLLFENLVDRKKMANFLGISLSYVDKLMRNEGLPYFKVGRSVRFRIEEVMAWLQQRSMP